MMQTKGESVLFKNLIFISILTNISSTSYAVLANQKSLLGINFILIILSLTSHAIGNKIKLIYGYHMMIVGYLIAFCLAAMYGANYYASITLFVVSIIIPLLFTKNKNIHIFYFVASVISCIFFVYFLPSVQYRNEPNRIIVEGIIATGIMLALFRMITYFISTLEKNKSELQENEVVLLEQKVLIEYQISALYQKNQDLEKYIQSNIQLEQFAHMASHDLKSPLRTISSFSGLLKKSIYDKVGPSEKEYIDFIEHGAKKMALLINDLLQYSKVNSLELKTTQVNFNTLISQVLDYLSFDITRSGAQIEIDQFPPYIEADEIKMTQVMLNLITNAIKFAEPNVNPKIFVHYLFNAGMHQIEIVDEGIGIDENYIDSIFKPFKKLHQESQYEGTGMGLSICQKIIEQHGGQIWLDKSYVIGSKFIFTLPA